MVLTKTNENESNTAWAQGGVAAVWDKKHDSYQKHIEDTLDAGDGLCNQKIVEIAPSPWIDAATRARLLEAAVKLMASGGIDNKNKTALMADRELTGQEMAALVAFLRDMGNEAAARSYAEKLQKQKQ